MLTSAGQDGVFCAVTVRECGAAVSSVILDVSGIVLGQDATAARPASSPSDC